MHLKIGDIILKYFLWNSITFKKRGWQFVDLLRVKSIQIIFFLKKNHAKVRKTRSQVRITIRTIMCYCKKKNTYLPYSILLIYKVLNSVKKNYIYKVLKIMLLYNDKIVTIRRKDELLYEQNVTLALFCASLCFLSLLSIWAIF